MPFVARIVAAMALGGAAGTALGTAAAPLGLLGTVVIGLIKALAAPLLAFAIVDAFLRTRVRARSGAIMVGISAINAAAAMAIGMTIANTLTPGEHLLRGMSAAAKVAPPAARPIDLAKEVAGYVPTSIIEPFRENSIISIVVLAVLAGAALRKVKTAQIARGEDGYRTVERFVETVFAAIEAMLGWIIVLVPLAVFGVVAKTIGENGLTPLRGLAMYVGAVVLGLGIQVGVVYQLWLVLVARRSPRWFWSGARDAIVYAAGASSSLATLPVTLKCLDRMKVSPQAARLSACVGTNLNNDGILLYEAMAVLMVAQAYGVALSPARQALAAAACLIASVGIAAVPDAGLISLPLVLATVGLPLEIFSLLLTVDWLLSRCRAATNVSSDLLGAVLLDRFGVGVGDDPPPIEAAES